MDPATDAETPAVGDPVVGQVLDAEQLAPLDNGFKGATIYEIVCVAAFTGMRRGEILALRWSDLRPRRSESIAPLNAPESTGWHSSHPRPRPIAIDGVLIELLRKEQDGVLAADRWRPGRC
jgi:integrase